jgi:hypothetical protein
MEKSMEDRLSTLEQRLSRIESLLGARQQPEKFAEEATKEAKRTVPHEAISAPQESAGGTSSRALGTIATLCFILAGSYVIKLAIDAGWLTPLRQLLLAFLFGALLIGAGLSLRKTDRKYSSYLPAAGVVVLFGCALASHLIFHLVSFPFALAGLLLISAGCLFLYRLFAELIYAVIATLGCYLLPTLLDTARQDLFVTNSYFLLCSLLFSILSSWVESRTVTLVGSYFAMGVVSALSGSQNQNGTYALLIAAHFLIYALGVAGYSIRRKTALTPSEAYLYFPVLIFFYAIEYSLLRPILGDGVHWLSLGFVGMLWALYFYAQRRLSKDNQTQKLASGDLVAASSILIGFHSLYLGILPENLHPLLLIGMLLGMGLVKFQGDPLYKLTRLVAQILFVVVFFSNYFSILLHSFKEGGFWVLYGLFTAATLAFLHLSRHRQTESKGKQEKSLGSLFLGAGHIQAIIALFNLTEPAGSLAVSGAWALYAVAILGIGFVRRDPVFAKSSLVILIVATGKALLYDLSAASAGVRILCLLLTGALLYGAGFLFRRIEKWVIA